MRNAILVVDSRSASRDELVDALDRAGFVGIPAATGREAMDYLDVGGRASVILLEGSTTGPTWASLRDAQRHDATMARIPMIAIAPTAGAREFVATDGRQPADVAALVTIVQHLCASYGASSTSKSSSLVQ